MGNLLSKDLGFSEENLYDLEEKIHGLEDCDDVLILLLKDFLCKEEEICIDKYSFMTKKSGVFLIFCVTRVTPWSV